MARPNRLYLRIAALFALLAPCLCGGDDVPVWIGDCCLEDPMEGGAWEAAVHGVAKSQTQLSNFTFLFL